MNDPHLNLEEFLTHRLEKREIKFATPMLHAEMECLLELANEERETRTDGLPEDTRAHELTACLTDSGNTPDACKAFGIVWNMLNQNQRREFFITPEVMQLEQAAKKHAGVLV